MTRYRTAVWVVLAAALIGGVTSGQTVPHEGQPPLLQPREEKLRAPDVLPPRAQPDGAVDARRMIELRRRLMELDKALALGNLAQAEILVLDLEQHGSLARELRTRRIKLAQLQGRHEQAIEQCREALLDQSRTPGLWRSLGESLLAVGELDSARVALDKFMGISPNRRSAAIVSLELCLKSGHPALGVGLIDSMRTVLTEPRFLGRQRALGLLALGRQKEAAVEVSTELRANPYNFTLVRTELLEGPYVPGRDAEFLAELTARAGEPEAKGVEGLLVVNLLLSGGHAGEALQMVEPLYAKSNLVMVLLQNSLTLGHELKVLTDQSQVPATVEFLVTVLGRLSGPENEDMALRRRAANYLADVCGTALEMDQLGSDPARSVEIFGQMLDRVRTVNPASEQLYSSQIKLAIYMRDRLHDPAAAARRLEDMLLNLDLPTEGLALVRLNLGESYLAAGDTSRGRIVLTKLGRDPEFRQAGGHAHYHLARLDLAEGNFATARDRFAVIALDNPGAAYANDALDLGLIIAEEMDNPTGGPEILALYAPVVYFDLTAQPDRRVQALAAFVSEAGRRLDMSEPQHLYEKALFELAAAYAENGRSDEAVALLKRVALEHPDGRYPPRAMQLEGEVLQREGRRTAARSVWRQLLAQYPDYLFIDDVRDSLRTLPN